MAKKGSNEQVEQEKVTVDNDAPRQPAADQVNAFNALAWLVEGASGLLGELRYTDLGLPTQFWSHAHAARKEGLLALRSLLDEAIARSERHAEKAQAEEQRRERRGGINIEF